MGITYFFTKNKEINEIIRQERTKRYDGLIDTLVRIVDLMYMDEVEGKVAIEAIKNYIAAYHRAYTYASDEVLERCNAFGLILFDGIESKEEATEEEKEKLEGQITIIYEAIRKDINPRSKYSTVTSMWIHETKEAANRKLKG